MKEHDRVPVHQEHLNAYFGKDDVYLDLHLSKVRFAPADAALFDAVLRGVEVIEGR